MTTPPLKPVDRLPSSWDPGAVEGEIYNGWVDAGYFTADSSSPKPAFSVVLPPPNVTGSLHLGHALDQTITDALCRRKRMQGYEVLWLPGTDHAGIATQSLVEKQLTAEGTSRREIGREQFLARAWAFKEASHGNITGQMRRIGVGIDWSRERFTMDEGLSRAVQTIFKQLFDAGLIYRAERLVNWSPVLQTGISDLEVDHKEVDGELVSFRYGSLNDDEPHIVCATTRLETMLGDTAIAVHPDDERYRDLIGTSLAHPFVDRRIPVIADDYVDPEFGSGAVKITPAHDPNDFAIGQRHDLPMLTIMDETAHIAGTGTQFDGLDRFAARKAIREALAAQGRIVKEVRPYRHSVGHSERSGEPIEPRLSMQWWVKVDHLAKAAGDAVRDGETTIVPEHLAPRFFAWVDDMHDWNISRQLWWGHRIPVWYGPADADGNREVVCCGPDDTPPAGYEQDPDVLDTWFSSGLFPFSTMGWPEQTADLAKFYPTSTLVTGYDIIFFWVARMMMFGTFIGEQPSAPGAVPFHEVLLHGLVRDEFGKKMSKSKGNGIDPLDWVDEYGADALRFTLARGTIPGADLNVGADAAASSKKFATKLFNATKLALMNDARVGELPDRSSLTDADRWILDRLAATQADADAALDANELGKACEALYHFAWDELCDWYLEIAKLQLQDAGLAESTRLVLGKALDVVLRLLHPTMPFVTEVLWKALTGEQSLVIASWPSRDWAPAETPTDGIESARRFADLQRLVTEIRRFRSDQLLKPGQRVAARLTGLDEAGLSSLEAAATSLCRLTPPEDGFGATASLEVRLVGGTVTVELDTSGTVDLGAERARLEKDLKAAQKEFDGTSAKLGNEAFLAKAPDAVVEKIRARQTVAQEEVERLTGRIAQLGGTTA
ncbi:Valine--tRNA ligase OS=Tsukamurella paurometabola (strain ATCC 8368 / DSM / CCUG 35730 / CIP 100753 / JCM 10117 / KCTC 9821 / NBRC 16120 / NCIMB 702349/ NCTC 13040) OX=521096 GN=valS PE=3 SV=1 [Tsukamurella paurometabola]|uniref:Valine--tRNA ligase n=1 Tax=Tsukamurella paurometabola (strain ATCC 8368 / DSM 20162 / CCUG 35730 / CIP 100753 / JCM 10117 / KCTC 9821 / NBRC 16120 / NCIMB 702349 / NCTC 13040) TaxID=521096 RepID=D5UXK3_TSUPD|nr:valine--tRNA ligase [Tsukamurella paurometabola]ADG78095.1 valyl-tRNA synthetase [Tsukamurella paurometabola DSM 20162]SUP30154.1 Valine--tRNA ligase [Tsukamurella paurometabola]